MQLTVHDRARHEPWPAGGLLEAGRRRMYPHRDARRRGYAERSRQIVAFVRHHIVDKRPRAFVLIRKRYDDRRRRSRGRRPAGELRDLEPWKISPQDVGGALAVGGEAHRSDDAEPHAVPRTAAVESISVGHALEIERCTFDVLPAKRATGGDAQILSRDPIRRDAFEIDLRHASRLVARDDAHLPAAVAAKTRVAQRTQEVRRADISRPNRTAAARVIFFRRQ